MNVHVDCQDKAPKCQPKSGLLRRQKSTSEIESRVPEPTVEEESKFNIVIIFSFVPARRNLIVEIGVPSSKLLYALTELRILFLYRYSFVKEEK